MKIERLREFFGRDEEDAAGRDALPDGAVPGLLHEEQKEKLESDISILEDEDRAIERKLHREAEKTVQSAAEDSVKRLHVVQMGRCPQCGNHLNRHLFASACEACGWHAFDAPRTGPVRVHMKTRAEPIEGDRAYLVKPDFVLVVKNEVVVARVGLGVVSWIEYQWSPEEIDQRHKQVVQQMKILCGWCDGECDSDRDGFHMAQVAFGSTQERYTFCSDNCYEAFRKMYPARVHRNCYERNCADCNLCVKRYSDDAEGFRLLAKDYLRMQRKTAG